MYTDTMYCIIVYRQKNIRKAKVYIDRNGNGGGGDNRTLQLNSGSPLPPGRATIQLTARISAQPGNVCDDRRVTTPRCIVNEDSGMRNFVKTNRGTQKTLLHCQRIQRNCPFEVIGQMAVIMALCHLGLGDGRRLP